MTQQTNSSISPCCFCAGKTFAELFQAPSFQSRRETFTLEKCCQCQLVRSAPVLRAEELERYYQQEYYGDYQQKFSAPLERMIKRLHERRARAMVAEIQQFSRAPKAQKLRVLDIGCGRGAFLRSLAALGCECFGTELSSFPVSESEGIHFLQGELKDLQLETNFFDGISIWHVLEHTTDPAATLAEIARILKPGGVLSLAVPNFGSCQSRTFTSQWFHLDLPRHTHHFSRATLHKVLRAHNFRTVKWRTFSLEQGIYGILQSAANCAFPSLPPNHLYSILKNNSEKPKGLAFALQCAAFAIGLPAALITEMAAASQGKGSCLVVNAIKIR